MVNKEMLEIIFNLQDRFSYSEYVSACEKRGIIPEQLLTFSQRVGISLVSRHMYPDDDPVEAYQKLLDAPPISQHHFSVVVEESRGVGDTVAKITHATGLDKLAQLYTKITGKDCGCHSRQEALNKLFPYGVKEE